MKKLLLSVAVVLSISNVSKALIMDPIIDVECSPKITGGCLPFFTTSLPSIMITSEENLSIEERREFIRAEARSLVDGITTESVLLQDLAEKMGVAPYELAQRILSGTILIK